MNSPSPIVINYDGDPLLETEHAGLDYRFDPGKQGTALCISTRPPGTYDWQFLGEAKFDNALLRCTALDRATREHLGRVLKLALEGA
jgi:hypothetical protein